MDNIYIIAAIISIAFFFAKFLEMRFVNKESKPLKDLVRDSLLVYFCSLVGFFIFGQVKPLMNQVGGDAVVSPAAFTDAPGF
jgi:hypothetical protein